MDKMVQFLRSKGLYLALTVCLIAAFATGLWTLHTVNEKINPAPTDIQEETPWDTNVNAAPEEDIPVASQSQPPVESSSPANASDGASSSQAASEASLNTPASSVLPAASYALPVAGKVMKAYSGDELVFNETLQNWRTHNGADYSCNTGDTVSAPCSGTVTKAESEGNWGGVVEITEENGTVWRVCGLNAAELTVKANDKVSTGDALGKCGTIPSESEQGAHIHLEVIQEEVYVNPADKLAEK